MIFAPGWNGSGCPVMLVTSNSASVWFHLVLPRSASVFGYVCCLRCGLNLLSAICLNMLFVCCCLLSPLIVTTSRYVVPTGRVKVLAGRYVVPTGKDNVIVSAGRSKVTPAGRTILVLVVLCLPRDNSIVR
ncbi:hypothetical protein Tco_1324877 [Tanacetum coccineum]